jgi:hypothetical protein
MRTNGHNNTDAGSTRKYKKVQKVQKVQGTTSEPQRKLQDVVSRISGNFFFQLLRKIIFFRQHTRNVLKTAQRRQLCATAAPSWGTVADQRSHQPLRNRQRPAHMRE